MKKYFRPLIPDMAYVQIDSNFKMFLSVIDISGPSFDLSYDKTKAFYQYEKADKDLIEKHINNGDVFLDIGANIGHFSFYFKRKFPELTCHLFEPIPWLGDCINQTINTNKIEGIKHHNVALSDQSGDTTFFIDTFNDGGHSLLEDKLSIRSKKGRSVQVKVKTLDEYAFDRVDFFKVDVQGAEKLFIKGALKTIKKFSPKMLIEVTAEESIDFLNFLESETGFTYKVYSTEKAGAISREDMKALALVFKERKILDCNFLFIPAAKT